MSESAEYNQLERAVRWTLMSGLTASVLFVLFGWLIALTRQVPENPHDTGILSRAAKGDGPAILELGLVVLMLTPVARVLVLTIGWLWNRDWTFSLIAFCVLALLGLSVILGTG
jgi:uncharacterized membrane protein